MKNIPAEVLKLLRNERLCSLATTAEGAPHVCLMNFTYVEEEGLVILSSRPDTTKVRYLQKNPAVAMLFFNIGDEGTPSLSCTVYGTAAVLSPEKDRPYREMHYNKNREMGRFILGDHISIITVRLQHAALSDVEDSVQTWALESDA